MKPFKEVIDGIRKAVMAPEVREDIAQMGEYVEQFANTAGENIQKAIDPTLSVSGKAADAAKVGEAVGRVEKDKIDKPSVTDDGKIPRAKDGEIEWVEVGQPTDEQTNSAVTNWLNEHPEATTTVQDGAITEPKIANSLLSIIKNDYVTPEMFGAVGDGVQDDTVAFNKAIEALNRMVISKQLKDNYPYIYNRPMLILTKEYKVDSINIRNNSVVLIGYDGAILHANEINLFSECVIENISFVNLVSGIKFSSESDFNVPIIRNCSFYDCKETLNFNLLRSANVVIEKCKFFNCNSVLYNYADKCVLRNCFIEAITYNNPPIYNDGNLIIDSCIFVPSTGVKMAAWIENHNRTIKQCGLTLINSRFGGENGGSSCIIYNYAGATTNSTDGERYNIVIDNCQISCSGKQGVLKLYSIPNRISITNVFGLFDCVNGLITTSEDVVLPKIDRFISGIVTDGSFIQSKSYPIVSQNIEYLYNNKYCESIKKYTANYEKRKILNTGEEIICNIPFDGEYTTGLYKVSLVCILQGTSNIYVSDIYVRVNNQKTDILTENIIFKSDFFSSDKLTFSTNGNGILTCINNSGSKIIININIDINSLYQGTANGNAYRVIE